MAEATGARADRFGMDFTIVNCPFGILLSALHQAHDAEEAPDQPRLRFVRGFLSSRNQGSGVVLQFLVTMRTRVCVHEIAEFNSAVRAS